MILVKRSLLAIVAAASLLAVAQVPASAEILVEAGCVEWSREEGCITTEVCTLDTSTRTYQCEYYSTRYPGIVQGVIGTY